MDGDAREELQQALSQVAIVGQRLNKPDRWSYKRSEQEWLLEIIQKHIQGGCGAWWDARTPAEECAHSRDDCGDPGREGAVHSQSVRSSGPGPASAGPVGYNPFPNGG